MAFQHASHFAIGTLNAATYMSPTVIHAPSTSDPMEILHRARAVEATHTSKTASYAPKCHPGTRAKVTSHIVGWAVATGAVPTNESPRSTSVLWLQGPAGGGKTCIMREVAKRLVDEKMAIATYFFSNRLPGLSSEDPFVATVIYQLVLTLPTLKPFIMEVIVENPHIFGLF